MRPHSIPHPHPKNSPLRPWAFRFFLGGHALLLLSLADYLRRLAQGAAEPLLYREHYAAAVGSALIFLWMTVLGFDLLERRASGPLSGG